MAARLEIVGNGGGIVETAQAIAIERRKKLLLLCDAVLSDDHAKAKLLAKELSGKESNRIDPGKHRRASG